ncbi:MAG: hypothetical protein RBR02_09445 [Desulfuromonadaceae bacterium]|nr:hypothetical protein [Desulfuromonadaceae bacterium]
MSNSSIRKNTTSISLSSDTLKKIENLKNTGNFSSSSDVVFIAVCELMGKIKTLELNPNFEHSQLFENIHFNTSNKKRMPVAFNIYINNELENISNITKKSKSFIVDFAINDFIENYNKPNNQIFQTNHTDFPNNKQELKDFILQIIKEANNEH